MYLSLQKKGMICTITIERKEKPYRLGVRIYMQERNAKFSYFP